MTYKKTIRLQVFLSHSGVCSRRSAGEWIKNGRCRVNGKKVLEPAHPVNPDRDEISLDGKKVYESEKIYVLLNKPRGVVTTRKDKFAEKTVLDILPGRFKHLYPVGRLDKYTNGLLLLTNDGELTYRLTHPSFEVDKSYRAVLDKNLDKIDAKHLEEGVLLDGVSTYPCKIIYRKDFAIEITLHEGKKRQVRRMFEVVGYKIRQLTRIKEAHLTLGDLKAGQWRLLSQKEIRSLYQSVGL